MRNISLDQIDLLNEKLAQTEAILDLLSLATDPSTKAPIADETFNNALWNASRLVQDSHKVIDSLSAKGGKS